MLLLETGIKWQHPQKHPDSGYFSPLFVAFHELSVYPKKELPFFILFTAALCTITAILALLTHQYPEEMGLLSKQVQYSVMTVSKGTILSLILRI